MEFEYIGKNYIGVTHGKIYEIIDPIKIKGKMSYYFINDSGTVDLRRASLFKETTISKNMRIIDEIEKED